MQVMLGSPQVKHHFITDTQEKVKDALNVWADWMHDGDDKRLGYGSPIGFEFSERGVSSWEDFEIKVEKNLAINVQAIYEGLPNLQQLSIDHFHLHAVWKSSRASLEDIYSDALVAMEVGLRRRGLV